MSQENVEIVQAALSAWNTGDMNAVRVLLDPDAVLRPPEGWPEPGPYVGREAVTRFLEEYRSAWEQVELRVEHLEERRGALIARCRWLVRGASSGAEVPVAFTLALRFGDDGLVERIAAFFEHEQATVWVEATGSRA